jgi:hypothetical protein
LLFSYLFSLLILSFYLLSNVGDKDEERKTKRIKRSIEEQGRRRRRGRKSN